MNRVWLLAGAALVSAVTIFGCGSPAPASSTQPYLSPAATAPPATGVPPSASNSSPASPTQSHPPTMVVSSPAATPLPLSISNGTTIAVTLVVNGTVVETIAPGGYENPIKAALPPLPWSIETRSPSGRVLSQLTVNAGDVVYTTPDSGGHSSAKGDGVRVDLPCGRLDVWSGPPMLGPTFIPNMSLSCD